MKTAPWIVEQLEPRIAPAAVTFANGANLLSAGDHGNLSEADAGGDATTLVECTGGMAMVFWDSTAREITGISVANGANIEVLGNVHGDIVTNLEASGFLSDSDNNPANGLDGGKLLPSSIAGIKTNAYFDSKGNAQNGDVGRIIAGGSVSNVNLNGDLNGVYAGDGIFDAVASASLPDGSTTPAQGIAATQFQVRLGQNFDASGKADISTMTLKMSDAAFAPNAFINGVSFASGVNVQIFAGDGAEGSTGAPGGSILEVTFVGAIVDVASTGFFDGKSFVISAGDGGKSIAEGNGGAGGSINGVAESGSGGDAYIHAGPGGDGGATKGNGGIGGWVSNLDLQDGVINHDIQSGIGGSGIVGGAGGGVSYVNITSQGQISLAGPFLGEISNVATHKDFFIINRSTGEMAVIDGSTMFALSTVPIPAKAVAPVDAITTDLNRDSYLDVVIVYADGSLGTLVNHSGDGTFHYTVKDLGYRPSHVLAGDFVGDGGNPELAIASTNKLQTSLRLYTAADPTIAGNFSSDTSKFKPFVWKKGNLADVAGGDSAGLGSGMQLNPEENVDRSDLVLAFADGALQGMVSQGSGTTADPFTFSKTYANPDPDSSTKTLNAPKAVIAGRVKNIDFNYASVLDGSQAIAVVNAAGTAASLVVIDKAPPSEPVEGEPAPIVSDQFIFNLKSALPLPSCSGTILQAAWTKTALSSTDTTLMLLTSTSTNSYLHVYNSYDFRTGLMSLQETNVSDFLINSVANNFQFSGKAASYAFTTGYMTMAVAYQQSFPVATPPLVLNAFTLPFAGKDIKIQTGDGGNGSTGAGGKGGDIRSLNFDSNFASVTTGDGGLSVSGAGGSGGSIFNAATFRTGSALITPSMAVTDTLTVAAGNGATVTGAGVSSRGGSGGSISGVTFNTTGHIVNTVDGPKLIRGDMSLAAGNGGSSESLAAGSGGSISSTTITNANDVLIEAGVGGDGTVGAKATGGSGGSVVGLLGGDTKKTGTRVVEGNVIATAGKGGNSANARAGSGGNVSTVNISTMEAATATFDLIAGAGGSSSGIEKTANAGAGGSVIGVTAEKLKVQPNMVAGNGGHAVNGSGGNGGSIQGFTYEGGLLNLASGIGGNSSGALSTGTGGAGGAITGINARISGSGYMTISGGHGGNGVGAGGGVGGTVTNCFFKLNPNDRSTGDETLAVTVISGIGGNGSKGGAGGLISGISCEGVYDNLGNDGFVTVIDPIAMKFEAGDGGNGSTGDGGAGGSVNFSKTLLGLSQIDEHSMQAGYLPGDEALRVTAGDGGDGGAKGGVGGSVSGLKVANVKANNLGDPIPLNLLSGAFVQSGNGGDGTAGDAGSGGLIGAVRLSVERQLSEATGNLRALSGGGGDSVTGKGGAGGLIQSSFFTSVNGNNADGYGILLQTGDGGSGGKGGGVGGNLTNLSVSLPSVGINGSAHGTDSDIYGAVLLAGDGGHGNGISKAKGGAGGSISGLNQQKDVYSVINLLQAGSGGNSSADTAGAVGGSITNIKSAGAIGAQMAGGVAQGLFNGIPTSALIDSLVPDKHQGIFAGLGGSGSMRGLNGSVSGVSAPAIAAIAAANLSGAFEQAATVSKIASLLVAFDPTGGGTYHAGDGFIRAAKFDPAKDLVSLDPNIVSSVSLTARTEAFVNP